MLQSNVEVLNGKEAAAYLRIGYFSLMRKAKAGEVPSFRVGGRVFFRRSTLEKWISVQEGNCHEIGDAFEVGKLRRIKE
jgi:excisionase family DNA binding protein